MTLFDDERYAWRETYFVLFEPERRPLFVDVRKNFDIYVGCFSVLDKKIGEDASMESITIASYEDHVAIEVVYSEGEVVLAESESLFITIGKDCPPRERELLRRAKKLAARYSVLHFEQVAGTAIFKTIKKPELQFVSPLDRIVKRAINTNLKKINRKKSNEIMHQKGKLTERPKFCFDPVSYKNCSFGEERADVLDDDIDNERIDPNTLILILDVLCTMTHGIAIDPSSGIVCGENMK